MTKTTKILIAEADDFSADVVERLRAFAQVDMFAVQQSELKQVLETYDVFWFRLGFKIDETVLSENTKCKVIATPVTGIDHIDEALCAKYNIQIACLRGEREFLKEVRATAEMAIGLAMSVMRNIPRANESVKAGHWERDWFRGNELYKKTMGIIGYGRLGKIVAEYALVFGMKVVVVEPRAEACMPTDGITFVKDLNEVAQVSDVISLHLNYNKKTYHLLGEAFFKNCKPAAYLLILQGGIIERALPSIEGSWMAQPST